jgi:CheY-like chemotaxis protein
MEEMIIRSAPCMENPWSAWIAVIPHFIWAMLLIAFACWIGRDTFRSLMKRVDKISIAGVELQLREDLEAVATARGQSIPGDELGKAARRLAVSSRWVSGARLLWVDDEPDGIVQESGLFEQAGAHVTRVLSSAEAFDKLNRKNYDLVLSDIKRNGDNTAGTTFANKLAARQNPPPLIFYVGTVEKPWPEDAFGITNRPDELVHLVLDSLARSRS